MRWFRRALAAFCCTLLAACAAPKTDCAGTTPDCIAMFGDCVPSPPECLNVAPGASFTWVDIDSSPTPAAIYVDGRYIGRTPLQYPLAFTSRTRYVVVVAEPLYSTQTRQEQRLAVPPVPDRIQFFMNNAERSGVPAR